MKYKNFEDFMQERHQIDNPEVLDDDIPDMYGDWISGLSEDEWLVYGDMYAKKHAIEVIDNLKI